MFFGIRAYYNIIQYISVFKVPNFNEKFKLKKDQT